MTREIVTVCQINGQWGLWLPGCGEHITSYWPRQEGRKLKPKRLDSKQAVLNAIESIRSEWRKEYGDELPWHVEVLDGSSM